MKTTKKIFALLIATLTAAASHAAVNPNLSAQASNQIVTTVINARYAVLNGMTNAERVLGSNTFSMPLKIGQQRAELRAALHVNRQDVPSDLNSPEQFHLDVNLLTPTGKNSAAPVRLDYRGAHRSVVKTNGVSGVTRVVTFDNAADWSPRAGQTTHGRLIARVQQDLVQNSWRTVRTLLVYESN